MGLTRWWMLVAGAVLVAAPARAEGPAFDCAKAEGEVEKLTCQDEELKCPVKK